MADQGPLYEAILTGNMPVAQEATQAAIDGGSDPEQLVQEQMIPAMDEVGRRFEANEYFVPTRCSRELVLRSLT